MSELQAKLQEKFAERDVRFMAFKDELTLEIARADLLAICHDLRDAGFDMLVDVCGVDYLHYGLSEWQTTAATGKGFERAVDRDALANAPMRPQRFAIVWHLLSIKNNQRVRLRVFLEEDDLHVPSVTAVWPAANWFEREAFDLFGVVFDGHADLRRILTDYGFVGFPFRKDFPISGRVEMRYDAKTRRIVQQPVSIAPRVLEPKVIRSSGGDA